MSRAAVPLVALLLALSGCVASVPTAADAGGGDRVDAGPGSPDDFADPERDVLGWEDGYWYDEPIEVDDGDGLDERELSAVVARSKARVERVRGLEFREPVPVEVVSREAFRERQLNRTASPERRQFENATYEALFMIDGATDAAAVQRENQAGSVLGYYDANQDRIVLISDDGSVRIDETTLTHELMHALQDQHFALDRYDRPTRERRNALFGQIEGDARYVEHLTRERCGEWECLDAGGARRGGDLANVGPYLINFQPYSDGPTFVRSQYRQGGWSRVNDVYAAPPVSTEQTIHPERYPRVRPADVRVEDRTRGSWERIPVEDRPNHAELGEAGVNAMLVYPGYDSDGRTQVVPLRHFVNSGGGGVDRFDPLNYDHPYTDGFSGDRLVPYRNADGETGYVWKLAFKDGAEAREFLGGYEQVLEYRNATTVREREGTTVYRIADDDPNDFGSAVRVTRRGETIAITSAPTVEGLDDVRSTAAAPEQSSRSGPSSAVVG